ncbi:MAG: DUF4886 domain-containing protein [Bacteroidales bacterium]|nr:DUF4886 domain-containing protein [Bacteroidales bacterium]
MKRMLSILLAVIPALWMSCSKEADFPPKQNFQVDAQVSSDYVFEETAGEVTFTFTSQKDWTVDVADESAKSWCSVTPAVGEGGKPVTITISVDANTTPLERTTKLVIKSADGASSRFVTVYQWGQKEEGSIRLLAIGNSFSDDAFEYLYQVLSQAGYTSITLGNLYIGGCTLATHAANFTNATPAYEYRVNTDGTWQTTKDFVSVEAIKSERWDYISLQQASGYSGVQDSFEPALTTLLEGVKALRPNAKMVWHMTWAYQQNSTHADFPKYDRNQMTMYNAIVSAVKEQVLAKDDFQVVVPDGTAIQNLRTSFIGDNLTRDGYHLSLNIGRYAAALMWAKQLSGCDLSTITWTPEGYTYTEKQLEAIKEAVNNAYEHPFEVTPSTVTDAGDQPSALEQILIAGGYDPAAFQQLSFDLIWPGYYNSASDNPMTVQTNMNNFATTRIFSKAELPNGTVLVQKEGYQYRPEGWVAQDTKNSGRPDNVPLQIVEVDDSWWGSYQFRAFNLQKTGVSNLESILDEVKDAFGIFVPKQLSGLEKLIQEKGYNPEDYTQLSFDLIHPGHYNSSSDTPMDVVPTMNSFAATPIFKKAELPAGTLIVQLSGFMYRPEGWTDVNAKNASRPENVSEQVVEVTPEWWGSYNYRGFNIQKGGADLTGIMDEVKASFGIFVPKYGSNPELEQIITDAGFTAANYKLLSVDLVHPGYYNSASDIPMTIQTNMKNFATTRIFSKSEFPDGTLIVQKSGFQYRPEGWTAQDAQNAGADRPGNISEQVVVVNDAWWGSFNFRAFNIQKTGVGDLTDIMDEVKSAFGIYVPVK